MSEAITAYLTAAIVLCFFNRWDTKYSGTSNTWVEDILFSFVWPYRLLWQIYYEIKEKMQND